MRTIAVQEFFQESPVAKENRDGDWEFIMFEYAMNFSNKQLREAYRKHKEKEKNAVDADTLRKLGYSEEAILKRIR